MLSILGVAVAAAAAGTARGHDKRQGDLHIGHPWTKPATVGGAAEVYFAIINRGTQPDRLIGADTPVAARAALAETVDNTVESRAAIELAPGRPVALRPGRLHVRLEGLREALQEGRAFAVTLRFATAAPVEIIVLVESAPGH